MIAKQDIDMYLARKGRGGPFGSSGIPSSPTDAMFSPCSNAARQRRLSRGKLFITAPKGGFIFSSSSKAHREVLSEHKVPYINVPPSTKDLDIPESSRLAEIPLLIARAKSSDLLTRITGVGFVVCTDTKIDLKEGDTWENTDEKTDLGTVFRSIEKKPINIVTAVVVMDLETQLTAEGVHTSEIELSSLPEKVVEEITSEKSKMDWSGPLRIEHQKMLPFVQTIEGNSDSIRGMPIGLLWKVVDDLRGKVSSSTKK